MIVYPKNWRMDYGALHPGKSVAPDIPKIIDHLKNVIAGMDIRHLAYSGGIDSTIMLRLMNEVFAAGSNSSKDICTHTISNRESHPDVIYARVGSSFYKSFHHEIIVDPTDSDNPGEDAVRQLFSKIWNCTGGVICCDGIDELMCGYYTHMKNPTLEQYQYHLSRLLPDHLEPLDKNSGNVKVYLPYLNEDVVSIFNSIPLSEKIDSENRKKVVVDIARCLEIPEGIISRNKYGFCDAFLSEDK